MLEWKVGNFLSLLFPLLPENSILEWKVGNFLSIEQ
jgi:hypothetical protein